MKITDRSTYANKLFGELNTGDVFRDRDGSIMMKIHPYIDDQTNCVDLEDGEGYFYPDGEEITLITNVELIIN